MGLRFFADHCVPNLVIQTLLDAGHEVFRLKVIGDGFIFYDNVYDPDFPGVTFLVLKETKEREYGEYRLGFFLNWGLLLFAQRKPPMLQTFC
jgi:hypothetical protein